MTTPNVRTRPLVSSDGEALVEFYSTLSPLTLHARFFVDSLREFPEIGLNEAVDQHRHLAIVAESIDRDGAEIVGVARAVVAGDDPATAEFAVVVADAWQQRGVGTALVRHLARDALRTGIDRWHVLRLLGNTQVDRIVERVAVMESTEEVGGVTDSMYRLVPSLVGVR
jgi:acetyltransferase